MLIVVGNFGRLGNQLWTHANSIAFALENRLRLLDTCFVHSDLFRGKEGLARELQDTVVPPENLPAFLDEFLAVLSANGLGFGIYGHVDVGCLHIRPALNIDEQSDRTRLVAVSDAD